MSEQPISFSYCGFQFKTSNFLQLLGTGDETYGVYADRQIDMPRSMTFKIHEVVCKHVKGKPKQRPLIGVK